MSDDHHGDTVKIPADVGAPDKILFGATLRQTVILGSAAIALWGTWFAVRELVPPLLFAAPAALVLLLLGLAVSCHRDGVTVDRWLAASVKQALTPRRRVMAPAGVPEPPEFLRDALRGEPRSRPAPLDLPVEGVGVDGVVDLGRDGVAAVATASALNFALRTLPEQGLLVAGFARWLNSLTGPIQITSRSAPGDMSAEIDALRACIPDLPHPLLKEAAVDYAEFLTDIDTSRSVLNRVLLITARETDEAGTARAVRRIHDAASVLSAAEVTVRALDASGAHEVLASALDPDRRHSIGA